MKDAQINTHDENKIDKMWMEAALLGRQNSEHLGILIGETPDSFYPSIHTSTHGAKRGVKIFSLSRYAAENGREVSTRPGSLLSRRLRRLGAAAPPVR